MILDDSVAFNFSIANQFLYTSNTESRLMISEKKQEKGNWTKNLQLVYINDGKGFRIENKGKILTLNKNATNQMLTWENESENLDGNTIQLVPVIDYEDESVFHLELINGEEDPPQIIID